MECKLCTSKKLGNLLTLYIRPITSFSLFPWRINLFCFSLALSLSLNLGITVSLMHSHNIRFVSLSIADAVLNWWCCGIAIWFNYLLDIVNWKPAHFRVPWTLMTNMFDENLGIRGLPGVWCTGIISDLFQSLWFNYLRGTVNWKTYPFSVPLMSIICEVYILDIVNGNSILFEMTFSYLFLPILDWCLLPTFTHLIRNLN